MAPHAIALDQLDEIARGELETTIQPSLSSLSDEALHAVTASTGLFSSGEWYRMLERLDLPAITGGDAELQFAIVSEAGVPVAVCPLLRARGAALYELYSFRRNYFESWIELAQRTNPQWLQENEAIVAQVGRYQRLLEALRCSLDDYLIVFNPLSLRTDVPIAASPRRTAELLAHLLAELKRHARQKRRPLWFFSVVEQDASLSTALAAADFERVFFTYDCQVDISQFSSFDDYLQTFNSKDRYAMSRDIRRTVTAGVQFRWVQDFSPYADDFTRLCEDTYSKHQSSNLRLTPDFWTTLGESLGSDTEAVVAEHAGQVVGFLVVVKNDARQEMYGYRIGRSYACGLDRVPFYFSVCIYEPIRRAIELGYRTVWLGPGVYETKTGRGAKPVALSSHFWFPRWRDRWLLLPYLKRYGETARREQQKQFRDPTGASTAAIEES